MELSAKGEKIRVQKLIDLQHVLTNLHNFTGITGRFHIKGPIILDLGSWWKEHYPNKARIALDADDKDSRQKNEENL